KMFYQTIYNKCLLECILIRNAWINLNLEEALRLPEKNVVLIGAGIMSDTLATLIKKLEPTWNITVLERTAATGEERAKVWNDAGNGHEAVCQLNDPPENLEGLMDTDKAIEVYNPFQISKQYSSHLIKEEHITSTAELI